jgi:uncharacterized phage protein gp47/JayE
MLDIHRYPILPVHQHLTSLVTTMGTQSTEDSSTYSDSFMSYRTRHILAQTSQGCFINLAQLSQTISSVDSMIDSSMLANQGSPKNVYR